MYTLTEFNGVSLPIYNPSTQWPTPPLASTFTQTASGTYDTAGQARSRYNFPYTLSYTAMIKDADSATLRSLLDELRSLVGTEGLLYRVADDDPSIIQWTNARLAGAPSVREVANKKHLEITFQFAVKQHWRSEQQWRFDTGILFDAGRVFSEGAQKFTLAGVLNPFNNRTEVSVVVAIGGELPIEDALIQIEAGSTTFTEFNLYAPNQSAPGNTWSLHFENPDGPVLAAGQTMTIDCANYSVDIDGQPAYQYMSLVPHLLYGYTHEIDAWTRFSPDIFSGSIPIVFDTGQAMGADTVLTVLAYDQWL